jgi:GAF domain-containing protein
VYGWQVANRVTLRFPPAASGEDTVEFLAAAAETMRTIFHAKAASVLLADLTTDELVFEAVSGEGAEILRGRRIPIGTGIAGAVLASGQPVAVDDVRADPRFATSLAEASGYVPTELMAAPLVHGARTLGVVEVFDRPQFSRFSLVELDMLTLFARQLGIAVGLLREAAMPAQAGSHAAQLARIAERLDTADERQRHAAEGLLADVERVLEQGR